MLAVNRTSHPGRIGHFARWLPICLLGAAMGAAGFAQQAATTIRTEVALVNVVLSAVDRRGQFIGGLKAEDFEVFEDRQRQKVEYFSDLSRENEIPLTIAHRYQRQREKHARLGEKDRGTVFQRRPSQAS
jgi:hypothetical protein